MSLPHRLLFPISNKSSLICTFLKTGQHIRNLWWTSYGPLIQTENSPNCKCTHHAGSIGLSQPLQASVLLSELHPTTTTKSGNAITYLHYDAIKIIFTSNSSKLDYNYLSNVFIYLWKRQKLKTMGWCSFKVHVQSTSRGACAQSGQVWGTPTAPPGSSSRCQTQLVWPPDRRWVIATFQLHWTQWPSI